MTEDRARLRARELAIQFFGNRDLAFADDEDIAALAAALLSAFADGRRKGREEMREAAAKVAYGRCGTGETASHLGASIAADIEALSLEAPQDKRGDPG